MSIVPNVGEHPAIFGSVSIGTLTGDTLYSAPFETSDGTPVAQAQLTAFELVWRSLPEVLAQHGQVRYDLTVTQSTGGAVPVPTLWDSGLSAGALAGAVARKLLKLRMHVYGSHAHRAPAPQVLRQAGLEVTELKVTELDAIEWVPPAPVDHTARVLNTLAAQINAWGSVGRRDA